MATFYIDYENVHYSGVVGIDELNKDDYVYVFFSQSCNSMNFETVKNILNSRCGVEFIEADVGTPSALDFQLVSFMFLEINQDDSHYIISKDHGYDAAIKMGARMGIEHIKRYKSINEALSLGLEFKRNENMTLEAEGVENYLVSETKEAKVVCQFDSVKNRKKYIELIKKMVQKKANMTLSKEMLDILYDGICVCTNKLNFYNFVRSQLGDKQGRVVYGVLNDEFMEIKMNAAI